MTTKLSQLELGLERHPEADRNLHLGGRSFYFFDFDDNVAFLSTALVLFHKEGGQELEISSTEFAKEHHNIGVCGPYRHHMIRWEDDTGTFRNFRDHSPEALAKLGLLSQIFLHDVAAALGKHDFQWKGPSWSCFYHATFNQRPTSLITARGHDPKTLADGVELFVKSGFLPQKPNFLSLFPVSNPGVRRELGDTEFVESTAELKQRAIRASVEKALKVYGTSPHHRFGMSDDDPKNIQLIAEEMGRLKTRYPEMSFFIIETQNGDFIKNEISHTSIKSERLGHASLDQIPLFDPLRKF